MSGFIGLTGRESLGDPRYPLHKAFLSHCVIINSHLRSNARIQPLTIRGQQCGLIPTASCRQRAELERVITGRRSALTQLQKLVGNGQHCGGGTEYFFGVIRKGIEGVIYCALGFTDGSSPQQRSSRKERYHKSHFGLFSGEFLWLHLYEQGHLEQETATLNCLTRVGSRNGHGTGRGRQRGCDGSDGSMEGVDQLLQHVRWCRVPGIHHNRENVFGLIFCQQTTQRDRSEYSKQQVY